CARNWEGGFDYW
nr:immunoglobulin heavy chain junction region [Mus musculus]MBK4196362.1 immunoglobulin heavy chain junction region [Mus musculus]